MYLGRFVLSLIISVSVLAAKSQDYDFSNLGTERFSNVEVGAGFCKSSFSHYHQTAQTIPTNSVSVTFNSNGSSSSAPVYNYIYPKTYTHQMTSFGIYYNRYFNLGNSKRYYYKMFGSVGKDTDNDPDHLDNTDYNKAINIFDFTFVPGVDIHWFGLEAGLHFGNNRTWDETNGDKAGTLSSGPRDFIPQVCGKLRLGRIQKLFFETRLGSPYFGFNGSKLPYTVGVGSGLGNDNGNIIRASVGLAGQSSLVFIFGLKTYLFSGIGMDIDVCGGDSQFIYVTFYKAFGKKAMKQKQGKK